MEMLLVDGLSHQVELRSGEVLECCRVLLVGLVVEVVPAENANVCLVKL